MNHHLFYNIFLTLDIDGNQNLVSVTFQSAEQADRPLAVLRPKDFLATETKGHRI